MTHLTRTPWPSDFEGRVQAQVDEIEELYAGFGETTNYLASARHAEQEIARNNGATLIPPDVAFWTAVALELRRRDAGEITRYNRARFDLIGE